MEIINYSGFGGGLSLSEKSGAFSGLYSDIIEKIKNFSLRGAIKDASGSFQFNFKNISHFVKSGMPALKKCLFYSPFALVLAATPFACVKYLLWKESHECTISFKNVSNVERLDKAMSYFAMNNSTCFDSDGNVVFFSENSSSEQKAGISFASEKTSFKQPVSFKEYTVRSGDTISSICQKFGLGNISTLIAVNNISNVRALYAGQKLNIPSTDGLFYDVKAGDSVESVSNKYNVSVEDILDVNDLSSSILQSGTKIFIPGAKMDSLSLRRAMGEVFAYPITAKWRLTSRFGKRADPFTGVASSHTGIDMACPTGTPIKAAMSGTVSFTGYSNVYGKYVIIKHIDGYQTLYGHMSRIIAKKGQTVNQGTQIGLVGSTGYSTGPHLHFSVYKNGKLIDPLSVLK